MSTHTPSRSFRIVPFYWTNSTLWFQFGRYSLLSIGIVYGAYHNNRLAKKEVKVREIEAKQKEVRDAKLAIEKKRNQEGEPNTSIEICVIGT